MVAYSDLTLYRSRRTPGAPLVTPAAAGLPLNAYTGSAGTTLRTRRCGYRGMPLHTYATPAALHYKQRAWTTRTRAARALFRLIQTVL